MIILKFGGSSVGTPERIENVIKILKSYQGTTIAVVFSAFQTVTDNLIKLGDLAKSGDKAYLSLLEEVKQKHNDAVCSLIAKSKRKRSLGYVTALFNNLSEMLKGVYLLKELTPRTHDYLTSFGERLSCYIISETLNKRGIKSEFLKASNLVKTDSNFTYARVDFENTDRNIRQYFKEHSDKIQIITGFIASNEEGEITTLGRGGSDYTASIFGAALKAKEIQIWTDVDGILTADPRKVSDSFPLKAVTYEEAMELSHFGAKVIHPPTMLPALQAKIKIRIKNTFNPTYPGTLILKRDSGVKFNLKGISSIDDISLLTIKGGGMVGVTGVASRLFSALAEKDINIIMITQGSSEHSICLAILPSHTSDAKKAIENEFKNEIADGKIHKILIEDNLSIIAVVGEDLRQTPGITGKVFDALGDRNINVNAIAQGSSMLNLSIVVSKDDLSETLNVLHGSLFRKKRKCLNLFLIGPGLVGGSLLNIISDQLESFNSKLETEIKLIGLANSKKMIIDEIGIDVKHWKSNLRKSSTKSDIKYFIDKMIELNLRNSILVDSTAGANVVKEYSKILKHGISITTPNKIANSKKYKTYIQIRDAAKRGNSLFKYETNVGAALPVVGTISDLVSNGDEIIKIEGVLSGTLSYIFNSLKDGKKFSEIVQDANKRGFTEPDPRDDLSGLDIARKLLILVRESGKKIELSDIQVQNLVPNELRITKNANHFMTELSKHDHKFKKMVDTAAKNGKVLAYIAKFQNGKASVKIEEIGKDHPFYNLAGVDNIISLTTNYYKDNPLVIKGPGAGPEFTASGVLSDIFKIVNSKG